jgi:predicted enzyme related to lactoylglutathione lyase
MITHIHSVPLVVSDCDMALKFYRDALGFEVTADITDPRSAENRWLTLKPKTGQTNIMLLKASSRTPEVGARLGTGTSIVLNTDDIETECAKAKSHGARIVYGPKRAGWGPAVEAHLADPDGNILLLVQPLSES